MGHLLRRLQDRVDRDRTQLARRILPPSATSSLERHPPALDQRHIQDALFLANRDLMIREHLPKGGVVAEVGVAEGGNAHRILEGTQPRELHLIDMSFAKLEHVDPAAHDGAVQLHEQDSAAALASFPDEYFDWIYIDGDHSYEGIKRDIAQATRKIKRDGLLVFNDYILFSYAELLAYGVVAAVNELCVDEDWRVCYFALSPDMYCDIAVSRRDG